MEVRKYPTIEYIRAEATVKLKCEACKMPINPGDKYITTRFSHYHGRCSPRANTVSIIDTKETD